MLFGLTREQGRDPSLPWSERMGSQSILHDWVLELFGGLGACTALHTINEAYCRSRSSPERAGEEPALSGDYQQPGGDLWSPPEKA